MGKLLILLMKDSLAITLIQRAVPLQVLLFAAQGPLTLPGGWPMEGSFVESLGFICNRNRCSREAVLHSAEQSSPGAQE